MMTSARPRRPRSLTSRRARRGRAGRPSASDGRSTACAARPGLFCLQRKGACARSLSLAHAAGRFAMTYIVNDSCIRCKYMDCVEVCPVDWFYEGENMLVIHTDACIDCGVCEPECPVDAIKPDTVSGLEKWLALNAEYAQVWPNITVKRDPP